jgi:hypothetical protein
MALLLSANAAFAQFRFDADIMIPFSAAFISDIQTLGTGASSGSVGIPYPFIVPDIQALLEADLGIVELGGGVRLFTVLIESLVYPNVFAEVNLAPVSINLSLGGFAFAFVGIYNGLAMTDIMVADLNVGLSLTKWFRATVGFFGVTPLANPDGITGAFYAGCKFVFKPKG